jgi:hypothetical protein
MERLLNYLLRNGARKGFAGSRGWAMVAIGAGTVRLLRRMSAPKPEVLWRQKLAPGDSFEVTVHAPPRR